MDANSLQAMFDTTQLWVSNLLTVDVLRQLLAFGIGLFLAIILRAILRNILGKLRAGYLSTQLSQELPSTNQAFSITEKALYPFSFWILIQLLILLFRGLGWQQSLLEWINPLVTLWFAYRFIVGFVDSLFSAQTAGRLRKHIARPIVLVIALLYLSGLLDELLAWGVRFNQELNITVGNVVAGLVLLGLFILFSSGSQQFLGKFFLPRSGVDPSLNQIISSFVGYAITLTGVLIALSVAGINLTALTVIAGGLSVGLGFGLQELISNFVSGFILLFERSIGPGDVIQVSDTVGVVQHIGIRSMRVKTRDNVELIVPNSRFLTDLVTNFTRGDNLVRVHILVGVSYGANPRQVEEALLEASRHPKVLDDPAPKVHFVDFGDSSIDFDLLIWTNESFYIPQLSSDLRYRIWNELSERQIEIPFPQRDIHIRSAVQIPGLGSRGVDVTP